MRPSAEPPEFYATDQVIVKLKEDAATTVAATISWRPARFVAEVATDFGVSALDRQMKDFDVQHIRRVAKPAMIFEAGVAKEEKDSFGLHRTYVIRVGKDVDVARAVEALGKHPGVEAVIPNYLAFTQVVPNDSFYSQQWSLPRINCPDAWNRTKGCTGVKVAVVDSGAALNHPDLVANLISGYDFVDLGAAPPGFHWEGDVTGRDPVPEDDLGHGTHVAGTIAAGTNNAQGVAGVTWLCKIMPLRALAKLVSNTNPMDIRGSGSHADIADAIKYAADQGAHVINLSLGGPGSFVLQNAIDYAFSKNCVIVAAMGNANSSTPSYPAAYPNVLAVGATDVTDTRASFSNFGPHIDVVAPGVTILSTVPGGGYGSKSGTSMATPHVAGLAALLKCCNMNASNTQIMDIIRNTARPLGTSTPNDYYGRGIIDAKKALEQCPPIVVVPIDPCKRWPWLPWCRLPWDICRRYPWLCQPFPMPIPKLPGPIPPGPLQGLEESGGGSEVDALLVGTEKELKAALRYVRRLRRGETASDESSLDDAGCACSD